MSTLPQLEKASRTLARAAKVLFEELELVEEHGADLDVAALWAALEEVTPRAAVLTAAATVVSLVPEDENSAEIAMRAALANRYATVRPFLTLLGESKALDAASAGKRVLAGVRGLPALARRKVGVKPLLPREVDDKLVPPAWRMAVHANPDLPQGAVDRDAHVVCVLEQLHRALNNRDVFASPGGAMMIAACSLGTDVERVPAPGMSMAPSGTCSGPTVQAERMRLWAVVTPGGTPGSGRWPSRGPSAGAGCRG